MASRTTAWALGLVIAACGAGCIDDAWAQHAPDAGPRSNADAGLTQGRRVDAGVPADTGLVFGAFWGDTIGDSFGSTGLGRSGLGAGRSSPALGGRDRTPPVGTAGLIGRGGGSGGNGAGRGWGRLDPRRDAGAPAR